MNRNPDDDEEPARTRWLSPDGRPWSRVWYGEPIENPDWQEPKE